MEGQPHSHVAYRCRYAGQIFAPDVHEMAKRQATMRTLGRYVEKHGGEELTEEVHNSTTITVHILNCSDCSYTAWLCFCKLCHLQNVILKVALCKMLRNALLYSPLAYF